ncbi:MAG: T9SS type A sorting domain-containing protein, partial [Bacteroidota bacterium]
INLSVEGIDNRFSKIPNTHYELHNADGNSFLSSFWHWSDLPYLGKASDRQMLMLRLPTANGWKNILHIDTASFTSELKRLAFSTDPERGEMITAWGFAGSDGYARATHLVAIDSNLNLSWKSDSLPIGKTSGFDAIPIGYREFIYADKFGLLYLRDDSVISNIAVGKEPGGFIKLHGTHILRFNIDSTLNTSLYDTGMFLDVPNYQALKGPLPKSENVILVENPRDLTLTFIAAYNDGVRLITIDRAFAIVTRQWLLSDSGHVTKHPAATFRGDTLYVVWEDYRDSIPAIYGRAVPRTYVSEVREMTDNLAEPPGEISISILPNPGRDIITISATIADHKNGILEIVDLLGNIRATMPVTNEKLNHEIDTRNFSNGIYFARIAHDGIITAKRFVVIH